MDAILKCCEAGVACRIATPLLKENQDALPALREFADEHHMHLVPAAHFNATGGLFKNHSSTCELAGVI